MSSLPLTPPLLPRQPLPHLMMRSFAERYTYRDWARERNDEPRSNAAIELLSLGHSSDVPPTFLDYLPASKRPAISDVSELTHKGRRHTVGQRQSYFGASLDPNPSVPP